MAVEWLLLSLCAGAAVALWRALLPRTRGPGLSRVLGALVALGGTLLGAGIVGGLVAAFYLSNLLASFLFGVEPRDAAVFIGVPVVLTLIGLGTAAVVARRAGRVDPLESLRHD